MIEQLKKNKNNFGVQVSVQSICLNNLPLLKILGIYYNYLKQSVETFNEISQFHTPFFCCYNWYLVQSQVDEYVKSLQKLKGSISMKMNNVLPTLMDQSLHKCNEIKGQILRNWDVGQAFKEVSVLQSQLAACYSQSYASNNKNYRLSCLYFLKLFQRKISLPFHVFIFIIAPYQLFYQNTSSKVLQVLVAIIIPYLIIIALIFFIFLPQQFQIKTLKKSNQKVKLYFFRQLNRLIVEPIIKGLKCTPYENSISLESEDKDLLIFHKPRENQEKLYWKKIEIEKGGNEFDFSISYMKLQVQKKITFIYENLFTAFQIMTICSVIVLFIDILVTYMLNLTNPVNLSTFILMIFFLIMYFTRYFLLIGVKDFKEALFIIWSMLSYNIIVVQFTQIYHILYYQQNPLKYCEKVSKLGEYLTMTFAIIFTLIIIESQTQYNGYTLLGIFAIYILINLIELAFQGISILEIIYQKYNIVKPAANIENINERERQNYDRINDTYQLPD